MTRHLRLVLVAALMLIASACTSNGDTTTTSEPTTTIPETTTTSTAPEETTTSTDGGVEPDAIDVTTYHFAASGGSERRPGPFLIAVADDTASQGDPAREALTAMLAGVPADAADAGISSEIPEGTEVVSLEVGSDGVASVELTSNFDDGGGSFSMMARLAQLTYTLTAVDGVDSVLLFENGSVVEVFSNEGIVLDGPMVRDDFEDQLPGILVEHPAWGDTVEIPFEASGIAAAFEGVFQAQLLVGDDAVFDPPFVNSSGGIGWNPFVFEVDAGVVPPTEAQLRVWEFSAEDGSVINERFVPIDIVGG